MSYGANNLYFYGDHHCVEKLVADNLQTVHFNFVKGTIQICVNNSDVTNNCQALQVMRFNYHLMNRTLLIG